VDHAVQQLLLAAEKCAIDTIEQHRDKLERLIESLLKHESLNHEGIEQCLGPAPEKNKL